MVFLIHNPIILRFPKNVFLFNAYKINTNGGQGNMYTAN